MALTDSSSVSSVLIWESSTECPGGGKGKLSYPVEGAGGDDGDDMVDEAVERVIGAAIAVFCFFMMLFPGVRLRPDR
jgi:hypothetical protein